MLAMIHTDVNPCAQAILDETAAIHSNAGWEVGRWDSAAIWDFEEMDAADKILMWGGHDRGAAIPRAMRERFGAKLRVIDFGWTNPNETYQVLKYGSSAFADWSVSISFRGCLRTEGVKCIGDGPVLFIAQDREEMGVKRFSPWFFKATDVIKHLLQSTRDLPVRVWIPDAAQGEEEMKRLLEIEPRVRVATGSLQQEVRDAMCVATVNSNWALEGLVQHRPVLVYGHAPYRHEGAVCPMDDDLKRTTAVISSIRNKKPVDLFPPYQDEIVRLAKANEWPIVVSRRASVDAGCGSDGSVV